MIILAQADIDALSSIAQLDFDKLIILVALLGFFIILTMRRGHNKTSDALLKIVNSQLSDHRDLNRLSDGVITITHQQKQDGTKLTAIDHSMGQTTIILEKVNQSILAVGRGLEGLSQVVKTVADGQGKVQTQMNQVSRENEQIIAQLEKLNTNLQAFLADNREANQRLHEANQVANERMLTMINSTLEEVGEAIKGLKPPANKVQSKGQLPPKTPQGKEQ